MKQPHEIERLQTQSNQIDIVFSLEPELFWFQGHFAIQPLLPGVAQLDLVMNYATKLLAPDFHFHSIQTLQH